jgi:hypothetical protein
MLTLGLMVKKSVQVGPEARPTCPCFGVFCFLCALIASLFGANDASADAPPAAMKATPFAAPAAVLGLNNPYLVAASLKPRSPERPEVLGFKLSKNIVNLVHRVETLARDGVALNQRKLEHSEKLNLRVESRYGGGVLQLRYRR